MRDQEAAIRAGYAPRSARTTASRMMTNANICREIDALMRKRAERTRVSADEVIRELTKVAFASIADLVDFGPEGLKLKPPDQVDWSKVSGFDRLSWRKSDGRVVTARTGDKLRALELLGKHLGLFSGKDHENDAPPIINISVEKVEQPFERQNAE